MWVRTESLAIFYSHRHGKVTSQTTRRHIPGTNHIYVIVLRTPCLALTDWIELRNRDLWLRVSYKWILKDLEFQCCGTYRVVGLKPEILEYNILTRQVMYVWRNIEVRSCNLCCSGKSISITYSEIASVALGNTMNLPESRKHVLVSRFWTRDFQIRRKKLLLTCFFFSILWRYDWRLASTVHCEEKFC